MQTITDDAGPGASFQTQPFSVDAPSDPEVATLTDAVALAISATGAAAALIVNVAEGRLLAQAGEAPVAAELMARICAELAVAEAAGWTDRAGRCVLASRVDAFDSETALAVVGAPEWRPDGKERALFGAAVRQLRRSLRPVRPILTDSAARAETILAGEQHVLDLLNSHTSVPQILTSLATHIETYSEGMLTSIQLVDTERGILCNVAAPSLPREYSELVREVEIGPDIGCCGAAAFHGALQISTDLWNDPNWEIVRSAVREHGLVSCWSMPFFGRDGNVLGTFAAYYRQPRAPTEEELDLIRRAAKMAAVVVENRRDHEREVALAAGLRAVLEAADELILANDLDTFHRRAVELARERLGFERCSFYLLDGTDLVGTYGTDRRGFTDDQRGIRHPFADRWESLIATGDPWQITWDVPLADSAGDGRTVFAHGWVGITPVRSARRTLGIFFNDTALTHSPPDRARQDVLAIYSSLVGNILERRRAEQALQASEQRHRQMFEGNRAVKLLIDPDDGAIVDANAAACRYFGRSRDELLAIKLQEIADSGEDPADFLKRARAGDIDWFRLRHLNPAGEARETEVHAGPVTLNDRVLLYSIVIDVTERRRAEVALRQTQERLSLLLQNLPNVVFYETGGKREFVSDNVSVMFGVSAEALTRDRALFPSIIHPADFQAMQPRMKEWRQSGATEPLVNRFRARHVDGHWVWMEDHMVMVTSPEGVRYMSGVMVDITERMTAEDALRDSEERFRRIFEESPIGVAVLGPDHRIRQANHALILMLGYGEEEMREITFADLLHPEELPSQIDQVDSLLRGTLRGSRIQRRFRTRGGETLWLELTSTTLDHRDESAGTLVMLENVTERRRAEDILRSSEEHFRSLIENAGDAITLVDRQGVICYESPSVTRLFGYEPDELVGTPATALIHPEDVAEVESLLRSRIAQGGTGKPCEYRYRHKDGSWRVVESIGKGLESAPVVNGRIPAIVINSRDITDRHQLEEQLRHSQKMEAVGRLAGGVAHDFNNMLAVISGYAQLLLERDVDPATRTCLQEVLNACERAAGLTRQLLAFSRKQVVSKRSIDLNELVGSLDLMLRRLIPANIELVNRLDPSLGCIRADPGQVEQIILNLVVNARDAMPRGGKLTISTANVDSEGQWVQLSVADTGCGMDRETLERVFEPFFTTKERGKGTGLGLATVYGIVQACEGQVRVSSEPGIGSTFEILLPRTEDTAPDHPDQPNAEKSVRGTETILLVEDEPMVLKLMNDVLTQHGYTVLPAVRGEDALRICGGHAGTIHLLLTDVMMPGFNGRELAERLLDERPGMRVLFMSGYTDDAIIRQGVLEADVPFIQKPFSHEALAAKVRAVLEGPAPQRLAEDGVG